METYNNLYLKICSINNLANAWQKARRGKAKKPYVIEFEQNLRANLLKLRKELLEQVYQPESLKTFILRDPKTRKISVSAFRDRIVHHAIINVLGQIFEKIFIYDSCANQIGKGNLFAVRRFDKFKRKITKNNTQCAYCFKADIKHYFQEVNHEVLLKIIKRKIRDEKFVQLIWKILKNYSSEDENKGMPLGNLTSQFFANVYLNELDYFVKHTLRAKYYLRYVDDFVILDKSEKQLNIWRNEISKFLKEELRLDVHPDKSKIILLSRGVDFVGFRNFYYFKLLKKKNINRIKIKIGLFNNRKITKKKFIEIFQGWNAYAKLANTHKLRKKLRNEILQ